MRRSPGRTTGALIGFAYASPRPHATTQIANRVFLYDANGNQAGWDFTNSPQTRRNTKHVFAGNARIVSKQEIPPTGDGRGGTAPALPETLQFYYHPDHLGSTSYVTDDARISNRFTGKEWDRETALSYFGARHYDQ